MARLLHQPWAAQRPTNCHGTGACSVEDDENRSDRWPECDAHHCLPRFGVRRGSEDCDRQALCHGHSNDPWRRSVSSHMHARPRRCTSNLLVVRGRLCATTHRLLLHLSTLSGGGQRHDPRLALILDDDARLATGRSHAEVAEFLRALAQSRRAARPHALWDVNERTEHERACTHASVLDACNSLIAL